MAGVALVYLSSNPVVYANKVLNNLTFSIFFPVIVEHKAYQNVIQWPSIESNILYYTILICLTLILIHKSRKWFISLLSFASLILLLYLFEDIMLSRYYYLYPFTQGIIIVLFCYIIAQIYASSLLKKDLKTTYKIATTDGLTGLYNHRYFQEKMKYRLTEPKRKKDYFSLLLIDIDFFKNFNDTYGHLAGDKVLIDVARTLENNVREDDIVARYGGEEMCVILDSTDLLEAVDIANKLVDVVANTPFAVEVNDEQKTVKVTISVGIANYPIHGDTVQGLIEFADQCLYRAKERGRNRVGELEDSNNPFLSKELELAKAKTIKDLEKLMQICFKYHLNFSDILTALIKDFYKKNVFNIDKDKP